MDDIYQENIIDHYKHPRNFNELPDYTHKGRGANASCGDMVEMYVRIENEFVVKASFKGIGCALSTASASMLTEKVNERVFRINEVLSLTSEDLVEMMGIEVSPTRMKCVSLPLRALQDVLK